MYLIQHYPLLSVAVLLLFAKISGTLARKLGQPAVVGKLLCGIILGPAVLNLVSSNEIIEFLAELGVLFLMFIAGLETDFVHMRKLSKPATMTAVFGVILPLILGSGVTLAFDYSLAPSLFVGAVLVATSVSISAAVLIELGRIKSKEGATILAAAILDDVLGILLLSLIVGFCGIGAIKKPLIFTITQMFLFFAISIGVGRYLVPMLAERISKVNSGELLLCKLLILCFLYSLAAEHLGALANITGAYIAGTIVSNTTKTPQIVLEKFNGFTYAFFAPLFFVSIGLEVKLKATLLNSTLLLFTGLIVLVAVISKVLGCFVGAKLGGLSNLESLRVGVGMMSRGEVALVICAIGLRTHILTQELFCAMIIMTLLTTLLTPILLRCLFNSGPQNTLEKL